MPPARLNSRPIRRRAAAALVVAAGTVGLALATGPPSSAQSERLQEVRGAQSEIHDELAAQNAQVDALLGEVSALRQREEAVAGELADQEAELASARDDLATAREQLARTREKLKGSIDELESLLVSIYRNGEPDMLTAILNSDGVDELATTSVYFDRIRDYQTGVVDRVRELRAEADARVDDVESSIARMEAARKEILSRQRALASSRAALEARQAELQAAEDRRREQLAKLHGEEKDLMRALAQPTPAPDPTATSDPAPAPATQSVPPPNGSTASINSDGTATAPANAPQAVQDAIAAGNQITNAPYLYGGGHGSFDSPGGYDCSGSVSYALHGGGLLSAPLDSTAFMTWGESGPGQWITIYSNPGHAYMEIAGIRFDTSGAPPRWQAAARDSAGFVATHPPGY